jgi:hypothetical protein
MEGYVAAPACLGEMVHHYSRTGSDLQAYRIHARQLSANIYEERPFDAIQ